MKVTIKNILITIGIIFAIILPAIKFVIIDVHNEPSLVGFYGLFSIAVLIFVSIFLIIIKWDDITEKLYDDTILEKILNHEFEFTKKEPKIINQDRNAVKDIKSEFNIEV